MKKKVAQAAVGVTAPKSPAHAWLSEIGELNLRELSQREYQFRLEQISKRYASLVPDDVRKAYEVWQFASETFQTVHADAAFGEQFPRSEHVDPARDDEALFDFVRRAHAILPTYYDRGQPNRERAYREVAAPQQRRWRVALMRFLDLCVSTELGKVAFDPYASPLKVLVSGERALPEDLSIEMTDEDYGGILEDPLPFHIVTVGTPDLRLKLFEAWKVKGGGSKSIKSGLSGKGGKWAILSDLLRLAWDADVKPADLENEYRRYAKRRRGIPSAA